MACFCALFPDFELPLKTKIVIWTFLSLANCQKLNSNKYLMKVGVSVLLTEK